MEYNDSTIRVTGNIKNRLNELRTHKRETWNDLIETSLNRTETKQPNLTEYGERKDL